MNTKKIEAFVRTVELGSVTKAAESLGATQSRLSHMLAELEEEFGLTLLVRNRAGVRLTDAGSKLYPVMMALMEKVNETENLAAELRGATAGTVRIGAFTSVAVHWLPGILARFQQEHPKVEFKMFNGDYHDVDQWLKTGEIDVGFVALPAPTGMQTVPLAKDELVAILPTDHPLAKNERVPVQSLAEEPFISLMENSDHDIRRALGKSGFKPNVRFSTKDDYALIAMVKQKLGVSVVPELLVWGREEGVAVRRLIPSASRTIALAYPSDQTLMPAVEAFIKVAQTEIGNMK